MGRGGKTPTGRWRRRAIDDLRYASRMLRFSGPVRACDRSAFGWLVEKTLAWNASDTRGRAQHDAFGAD